ncbi:unnamed protein product [Durusdinium trenchii]|uniref:Uncharacterized protein n=3 Tax=Durusdinium trenchii TaxID=1381693 RepID=A0ABP0JPL9_9DINO
MSSDGKSDRQGVAGFRSPLPPWLKTDDLQVRTPLKPPATPKAPMLPNTSWMQIVEERRRATEERLGPKADHPKPLTKLRGRTPAMPQETSEDWCREARNLDRKALARLLRDLKDRLEKEEVRTLAVEAKLPQTIWSKFDKLDPFSRASSLSKAKACGWYHSNAAGAVSQSEPSISMPRKPPAPAAYPYATAAVDL